MKLFRNNAQAITELAIFGAILIFVIGSIIRTSAQSGMEQNQTLKAMRWALSQSLKGVRNENKSRDSASLLVIEDRLSVDAGKFGSLERAPFLHSGGGTFSNTIFMPMDWMEKRNIPVMDVFVNGDHFVFSTGRFVVYDIQLDPGNANMIRVWDLTNNVKKYFPKVADGNWIDNCYTIPNTTTTVGCPVFFTIVPANSAKFCKEEAACPSEVNQRFDLNLNFNYNDDPKGVMRDYVMWQWKPIKGLTDNISINTDQGVYQSYDVDLDRKEEVIYRVNGGLPSDVTALNIPDILYPAVAQRIAVFDSQKGDITFTNDDTDRIGIGTSAPIAMGIQGEVSVYTLTKGGTYLHIKEGKAYVPDTGRFVRSTNRKDQVDVISRMFQLSNDNGRFCPAVGTPPSTIGNTSVANPVETCVNTKQGFGDCFNGNTVSLTCFDKGTNMLFMRSRILEKRGRKWVTQVE